MYLRKTFPKATLMLTLLIVSGTLAEVLNHNAFATAQNSQLFNLVSQSISRQSIWEALLGRRSGGTTRENAICMISPRLVWHREPLFIWFGGEGELEVKVKVKLPEQRRYEDIWSQKIFLPEGSNHQTIHTVKYNGEELVPGKEYKFRIYDKEGEPLSHGVSLSLMPQAEWQAFQTDLSSISNESTESQIWQRINYFSRHYNSYKNDTRNYLNDGLQEFLRLDDSQEKETYINQLYTHFCTSLPGATN